MNYTVQIFPELSKVDHQVRFGDSSCPTCVNFNFPFFCNQNKFFGVGVLLIEAPQREEHQKKKGVPLDRSMHASFAVFDAPLGMEKIK